MSDGQVIVIKQYKADKVLESSVWCARYRVRATKGGQSTVLSSVRCVRYCVKVVYGRQDIVIKQYKAAMYSVKGVYRGKL